MPFDHNFYKFILIFFFPLFLGGKRKWEKNDQRVMVKSHAFLLDLWKATKIILHFGYTKNHFCGLYLFWFITDKNSRIITAHWFQILENKYFLSVIKFFLIWLKQNLITNLLFYILFGVFDFWLFKILFRSTYVQSSPQVLSSCVKSKSCSIPSVI